MSTRYSNGFDAHTHLDFPAFDDDRELVCARARGAGVHDWIIAGADPRHWRRVLTCADETGGLAVLGIHPWWAADLPEERIEAEIQRLKKLSTPWGLGELGLDYAKAKDPEAREHQVRIFRAQLALSRELELPVVIHCVRAYEDLFRWIIADGISARGGMIHGWSGHADWLSAALKLGLKISYGSLITRSKKVAEAAKKTPIDALLLETDSPDQPLRPGARNEPAALIDIAEQMAELRPESPQQLLQAGRDNGTRLFGLEG